MYSLIKAQLIFIAVYAIIGSAVAQEPNIDNWEDHRAEALPNLHRIITNGMVVNAQDVFPLNYQASSLSDLTGKSR